MIIFRWEIGRMDYVFRPSPIVSPPFYIEPSRTFEFRLRLYPFGLSSLDYMILVLWRCDNNKRSITLTYRLKIDNTFRTYWTNNVRMAEYTYNFKPRMQFPYRSRAYLTKAINEYDPTLKINCTILNHDIFQDVDEDVMTELSSDYESLLDDNIFSDYRLQIDNRNFYVHYDILAARCDTRELNDLVYADPTSSLSILPFLYSGKLTTWRTNIEPNLNIFGNSLFKSMYPFIISEYSAKTSFVGNCYTFDWVIKNFLWIETDCVYTYLITKGDTVMQVLFYPNNGDSVSNFSINILKSENCFIRARVDIQINHDFLNLVDMSNSETNMSSLEVKKSISLHGVMNDIPHCVTNDVIKLKIYIYQCGFNAECTSNVDAISYTNVSNDTIHMCNLLEDFKKLFHHSHNYDYEIIVNYQMYNTNYRCYRANYTRFYEDRAMFEADYGWVQANFRMFYKPHERFRVHKAVLSARSSVFREILRRNIRARQIEINNIKPHVFQKMLLFMYCGELRNLTEDLAMDLYHAAYIYNVRMLVTKCSEFLQSNIRTDNVDRIQHHAVLHGIERLDAACEQFRRRNFNIIR